MISWLASIFRRSHKKDYVLSNHRYSPFISKSRIYIYRSECNLKGYVVMGYTKDIVPERGEISISDVKKGYYIWPTCHPSKYFKEIEDPLDKELREAGVKL